MGFHLRKSIKCGPFRLNLSNSGVGISTGIKGLRVGVDGKGRGYIGGGIGMLRYRKSLGTYHSEEQNYNLNQELSLPEYLQFSTADAFWRLLFLLFLYGFIEDISRLFRTEIDMAIGLTIFAVCSFYILFLSKKARAKFMLIKAMSAYKNSEYEDALRIFTNVQNLYPKFSYDLNELVLQCYFSLQDWESAFDFLNNHAVSEKRYKLLTVFTKLQMYDQLINHIQKEYSDEEKDEHPSLYAMMAQAFIEKGQKDVALQYLLSGPVAKRKMSKEMCAFRYALAECYELNDDKENALKQYQKIYAYDIDFEDVKEKINILKK